MSFSLEIIPPKVTNFTAEQTYAHTLITTSGDKDRRWINIERASVLYLISWRPFAHGIEFFDWLLFINGKPIKLATSIDGGYTVNSCHLSRISASALDGMSRVEVLGIVFEALNAYFSSQGVAFHGGAALLPGNELKMDFTRTRWMTEDNIWLCDCQRCAQ